MEAKGKATKAVLNHPLRILAMNCQSIKNKKANFIQLSTRQNQTSSFDAVRDAKASDAHGGVFTAFKRDLLCRETQELDTNCEIVRCKTNIFGCSSFYRPPDKRSIMITLRSLNHLYLGLWITEMHIFWLEDILIAMI